jgi:uncharacterized protein (DUF1800 family)
MTNTLHASIAVNRFGLGARPGQLAEASGDPRAWLAAQLAAAPPSLTAAGLRSSADIVRQAAELRAERGGERDRGAAAPASAPASTPPAALALRLIAQVRPVYVAEVEARFTQAVTTERPFVERLTAFWTNHFAVSVDKLAVLGLAGAFEREAIRPRVLGSFHDLLRAAVTHPAMLLYLDNHLSIGPNSRAAQLARRRAQAGRQIGLNENLAREILELHTLGVDGGYSQSDVTTFAGVISGWSIGGAREGRGRLLERLGDDAASPGEFAFRESFHEPGAKTLLGRTYRQDGQAQGDAVLRDLAASRQTARHLATKLARHFIADEPPAAAVDALAATYLRTDGDLTAVGRALVQLDAAWREPLTKFKTPSEFVVSTYRALELPAETGRRAVQTFEQLGQRPYAPGSPAGWPDRAADWDGSSALLKRVEWVDALAQRVAATRDASALAPQVLGPVLAERTRAALSRAESGAQALTLLLASPEFLRR